MLLLYGVLIITFLLLVMLIHMSSFKLYIYFNTFMYLAKKENYDKTNYIANSSFFKYFYRNNQEAFGNLNIEQLLTLTMILLSIIAYIGFVSTGHKNYGFLNYYYGDLIEYYFVNIFINIIITLAIIYTLIYTYWVVIEKGEDDKLEENEVLLKTFIIDNLSYEYLYNYYNEIVLNKKSEYRITDFVAYMASKDRIDYFDKIDNIFKLCFTNEILNENKQKDYEKRYIYIKNGIIDKIRAIGDINKDATMDNNIKKIKEAFDINGNNSFRDFYIIANYNHNNNTILPSLNNMIQELNKDISAGNVGSKNEKYKRIEEKLAKISLDITSKEKTVEAIENLYEKCVSIFRETIKTYKIVYDKYSVYYMGSLLLTNFIIIYAVLIIIYIIIKSANQIKGVEDSYSIYNFRSDMLNYGSFILIIYLFISCPIIIFGFN